MRHQRPGRNKRASTSSNDERERLEAIWQSMSKWVKRALKASGLFGTLLVMLYFLSLRSMPIDSLSSIGQLISPVAFASIFLFALLFVFWGIPAFMSWMMFIDSDPKRKGVLAWIDASIRSRRPLSSDESRRLLFKDYCRFALKWNLCTLGIWWFAVFAFGMPSYFGGDTAHAVIAIGLCVLSLSWLAYWFNDRQRHVELLNPLTCELIKFRRGDWMVLGASFGGICTAPIVVLLALARISPWGRDENPVTVYSMLIAIAVMAVFSNSVSVANMLHRKAGEQEDRVMTIVITMAIPAITLAAVVLALAGQAWLNSVMTVISLRVPNATVQLNQAGCKSMAHWGIKFSASSSAVDNELCSISKVTIFYRVGSFWLIGCDAGEDTEEKKSTVSRHRRWLLASFVQGVDESESTTTTPATSMAQYCS